MRILGLDPGLAATGWAVVIGDESTGKIEASPMYGTIKTPKWADKDKTEERSMRERIDRICAEVEQVVLYIKPDVIVMEDFVFFAHKGAQSSVMPALIEGIRMFCRSIGYSVVIYSNAAWKKVLINNQRATKEQIQHYLQRALGLGEAEWKAKDPYGHIRDSMALGVAHWKQRRKPR